MSEWESAAETVDRMLRNTKPSGPCEVFIEEVRPDGQGGAVVTLEHLPAGPFTLRAAGQGREYMPVPRCDTCRWWGYQDDPDFPPTDLEERHCQHPGLKAGDGTGHRAGVITKPNFGCVQWEAKDG